MFQDRTTRTQAKVSGIYNEAEAILVWIPAFAAGENMMQHGISAISVVINNTILIPIIFVVFTSRISIFFQENVNYISTYKMPLINLPYVIIQ